MITVATFSKPEEAHLFRMHLGAAGTSFLSLQIGLSPSDRSLSFFR